MCLAGHTRHSRPRARNLAFLAVIALLPTTAAAQVVHMGTDGNDAINGTPRADSIFALGGNDVVNAGAGNDDVDGGAGADDIRGGRGADSALYGGRGTPVAVTLDNVPNDGQGGEGDNVHSDVEEVFGGNGGDQLTGNDRANQLDGGVGNDTLFGGRGKDRLYGGPGDDLVIAFDGQLDIVNCGPGTDTVTPDGIDLLADCERRVPPPRVRSDVRYRFGYRGSLTRVILLAVARIPSAGAVEVRCRGAGCPFAANRVKLRPGQRKLTLTNLFRGRRLRAGARLEVRITKPGAIGKVVRFVMRRNAGPALTRLCLSPGSNKVRTRC